MQLIKAVIENIKGIEALTIEPKTLTILAGANEAGKTSAIEAIRSPFESGDCKHLLRKGTESGFTSLTFDNGVVVEKHIFADERKSVLTVYHPETGKVSAAKTWLDSKVSMYGVDPTALLFAKPADRCKQALAAIPMELTKEQLATLKPLPNGVSTMGHALTVLENLRQAFYDDRRKSNSIVRRVEASLKNLRDTLPEGTTDIDEKREEVRALRSQREKLNLEYDQATEAAQRLREEEIEALERAKDDEIAAVERRYSVRLENIIQSFDDRDEELADKYKPKMQEAHDAVTKAEAGMDEVTRIQGMLEAINRLESEYAVEKKEADKLDSQVKAIDDLRKKLSADLPIPGLTVDGDLVWNDVPWSDLNEEKRVRLCLQVAGLSAGDLGLLIIDNHLDHLDENSLKLWRDEAKALGKQVVGGRVSKGKLKVTTE